MAQLAGGSSYPPDLDEAERRRLAEAVKDWSAAHGLTVRPAEDPDGVLATGAPVTLFPSPFPAACFEQARRVQTTYNELYARISRDEKFLGGIVREVVGGDEFIANLWDVHLRVKEEGYTQNLSLGLFRSDYMVHQEKSGDETSLQIKQVEFNTIASSFGGLSSQTSLLHRFLAATEYPLLKQTGMHCNSLNLPRNESAKGLASGLKAAFDAYGKSDLGHETCVLFLVQGGERNVFDQRHLEYALQSDGARTPTFRLPFAEILDRTSIAATSKRQLLYHLPGGGGGGDDPSKKARVFEVAVAYLRAGYGPGDYPDRSAWEARHRVERSAAIKCPTVLTQLAGMKKVQQVLATPRVSGDDGTAPPSALERFLAPDSAGFADLWRTFTNIYPMDGASAAGALARRLATDAAACGRYVLKPQREGGGNNHYRSAIPAHLATVPEAYWASYILMELIEPPPAANAILRGGRLERGGVISELGRYGTCLWDQRTGAVLHNEDAGYLLRTKGDKSEEGGVAAGYGCMDSCCLV